VITVSDGLRKGLAGMQCKALVALCSDLHKRAATRQCTPPDPCPSGLPGRAVAGVARLGNGTTIPGTSRLGASPAPANAVPPVTVSTPS